MITSPVASSAMTAPTAGLGAVRPSMRRAMRSASSMKRRSMSAAAEGVEETIEASVLIAKFASLCGGLRANFAI